MYKLLIILLTLFIAPAAVMGQSGPPPAPDDPLTGSGDVMRSWLTADQLLNGFSYTSPIDETALALPAEAAPPPQLFEGTLVLQEETTTGDYQIIQDDYNYAADAQRFHLPKFDFAFLQHGSHLIPMQRGRIVTTSPYWDYLLGPGRVWKENDDGDYTRAAIPFALLQKNQNCTHNGALMFLFKEDHVSHVWYQITQETCPYFKVDMWGLLNATYQPQTIGSSDEIRSDFVEELINRLPTQPISALTESYPDVDLSSFGAGLTPEHLSAYGLIADGVNYTGPCRTRYGNYPYCSEMRHASFSTAKSAFAGMALMRLAQCDGLDVKNSLIRDYVPETATATGDWSAVTFENALDMATGNFHTSTYMADENGPQMSLFFADESYNDKMAQALSWQHHTMPGQTWVYHSSDTFVLVRALQNYLGEDVFDWLVQEVFTPLKIGPGAYTSARTSENDWQGQAFGGYGLWWSRDDVAKLAELMQNRGRTPDGIQFLHPDLVATAMQRTPDRGFLTSSGEHYRLGFWTSTFTSDSDPEFECSFYTPYMSGAGGIVVLLLPNGMTYYYFSDNDEFAWLNAVKETNRMRSHCLFPANIDRSGEDVTLTWQTTPIHARYRIWRSTQSDFMPGDVDATLLYEQTNDATELTYTDLNHCGDVQTNYSYRIEALDSDDVRVGLTGVLGEFDFRLQPGS